MKIQSAANHNISLETDVTGDVLLGGASVKSMLNTVRILIVFAANRLRKEIPLICTVYNSFKTFVYLLSIMSSHLLILQASRMVGKFLSRFVRKVV